MGLWEIFILYYIFSCAPRVGLGFHGSEYLIYNLFDDFAKHGQAHSVRCNLK